MRDEEVEGEEEEDEEDSDDDDESEEDDGAEPDDAVLTALVDAEAALRKNPASYNAHMKVGFRLLASDFAHPACGRERACRGRTDAGGAKPITTVAGSVRPRSRCGDAPRTNAGGAAAASGAHAREAARRAHRDGGPLRASPRRVA